MPCHPMLIASRVRVLAGFAPAGILFLFCLASTAEPVIRWRTDDPAHASVEATGVSPEGAILKVYATSPDAKPAADAPAMLGALSTDAGKLIFRPRFPLDPGVTYTAVLRDERSRVIASQTFRLPARKSEPTHVAQIYPTAKVLPENLLKFYIHFSAPMSGG